MVVLEVLQRLLLQEVVAVYLVVLKDLVAHAGIDAVGRVVAHDADAINYI